MTKTDVPAIVAILQPLPARRQTEMYGRILSSARKRDTPAHGRRINAASPAAGA
jgi:hypothetical protein